MLPQVSVNDDGNATVGTVTGGPFTGPDTFIENSETFYDIDMDVYIEDAIAFLQDSSSAPSQNHAYILSVNGLSSTKWIAYSNQLNPANNNRIVPKIGLKKGDKLYVRAVQLTEAATAAAEKTTLMLKFHK